MENQYILNQTAYEYSGHIQHIGEPDYFLSKVFSRLQFLKLIIYLYMHYLSHYLDYMIHNLDLVYWEHHYK